MDDNFGPTNALSDSKGKLPTPDGLFSVVLDPSMMPAYSNIFFIVFPDTGTSRLSLYTTWTDSSSGHPSAAVHPRAHSATQPRSQPASLCRQLCTAAHGNPGECSSRLAEPSLIPAFSGVPPLSQKILSSLGPRTVKNHLY